MQEAKETDRANVTNTVIRAMIARSIQTRSLATFGAELVS